MAAVYAVVFVDLLGFAMVLPVLPFHVRDRGGSGLALGVVLAGYSLGQVAAAPALGRLSDRYGRRPLLLLALAGSTASLTLAALAQPLWLLFAARLLAGLCGGSIGVAHAYAADLAPPQQLRRVMGGVGAAVGAGFTLGPALGAVLAPYGFATVTLAAAGIALVNLVFALAVLASAEPSRPHPQARPSAAGRSPGPVRAVLAAVFAVTVAFVAMETVLAPAAERQLGAGPAFVGWLLTAAGACLVAVQAVAAGPARRMDAAAVATAGALAIAVGLVLLPRAGAPAFVIAVLVVAIGYGLATPATSALLATAGSSATRGHRLGSGQAAAAAGRLSGPLVAGALLDVRPGAPALAAAGAAVAAAALLVRRVPRWAP
jgi:DHA1 family tetracycline resistance protein-like MFS transporter